MKRTKINKKEAGFGLFFNLKSVRKLFTNLFFFRCSDDNDNDNNDDDNNDDNNNDDDDESHEFAQLFSSLLYGFGNCDCTKMFRMQLPQAGSKGN